MTRPLYIGSGKTAAFAVLHQAAGAGRGDRPAVLICPPWGWDEVASYRVRREWAARLAAAGFPTLRFDLPATGNSAGGASDEEIVGGWVSATRGVAEWLADTEGGGAGIAALGIGLGGLLALAASAAGAPISALALWGAPGRGKRLVRETRAFSRMQPWQAGEEGADGFDPGVPEGWLEAGGFALSPGTLADLKAMGAEVPSGSMLSRALLLDRDGIAADADLAEALAAAGVAVESEAGVGWESFVSHPELAVLPRRTASELERWLLAAPAAPIEAVEPPVSAGSLELQVDGARVRETALALGQPWGRTIGVLAEPAAAVDDGLCAVFLNAGAVRSVGPNRMWAETARRWAAGGVPSLRADLQGIGEADGDPPGALQIGDFYAPRFGGQVSALLDELERRGAGRRFVLVGLCSGGYWTFRTAVDDRRVVAAFLVNAGALRWVDDLPQRREAARTSRAMESRWWRKLLRGEIEPARILRLLRAVAMNAATGAWRALGRHFGRGPRPLREGIEADLDLLRDRGTRVLIALSEDEPLGEELEREGIRADAVRWPNLEFADLPGNDHTLRPLVSQRAVSALLDRELDGLIRSAAARG